MKIKPTISNRIDPESLGIKIENEELDKIKESANHNDGIVDLAEVYDVPEPVEEDKYNKTVNKYLERDGIEYTERQYQKEYQLKAAHQIMVNGGSTAQISQALNVTLNEAKNLKRELTVRQTRAIKNMNVEQEVAKAYMFYDHIAAKALQMSNKGGDKAFRTQVEALKVALQAQTDKQKFLALAGVYTNGLRSGAVDRHADSADNVRSMLTGVLSGGTYQAVADEEEVDDGVEIL